MAAALTLAELGYPSERTIYFGESLGTGVLAALQARRTPAGVVLRSPFTELADVGAHHYPWPPCGCCEGQGSRSLSICPTPRCR
jgi:uncharacterized protein